MPYKDAEEQKRAQHRHYIANKAQYLSRGLQRRAERREWFRQLTANMACVRCGENERECLDFHHINPETKDAKVSKLVNDFRAKDIILQEIAKCVVVCANCHRKLHAGLWSPSASMVLSGGVEPPLPRS